MSRIARFEDLIAWQKARVLVRDIYKITLASEFARDFSLVDQIRRASTSIMSNIAEGFERGRRTEFHQFLVVAKGSCAEVRSQLYVAWAERIPPTLGDGYRIGKNYWRATGRSRS